jgi:glycosyltransferase involved in cell wall biosynthesis
MNKKISIIIPCYNQTSLLERNLTYLRKQTYKDFQIIIIDDQSSDDYPVIIEKFPDLPITYIRNDKNLGAMGNIFNSIFFQVQTLYKISLHEDDILHPEYLSKSIEILDKHTDVTFVCSLAEWFEDNDELVKKFLFPKNIDNIELLDKAGFIKKILDGKHIMWSSVVYRSSVLDTKDHDIKKYMDDYDVLCDRPFITSLINQNQRVALIDEKVMFTRDHGINDGRFKNITQNDCFNLMKFYRNNLQQPLSIIDNKKFLIYSTNILIYTYESINVTKNTFLAFIREGKKLGLIDLRYINKIGIVGILKLILGESFFNKLVRLVK